MNMHRALHIILLHTPWRHAYLEWYIRRDERRRFVHEAQKRFLEERPMHGTMEEYEECLDRYRVTYDEYMHLYQFWNKSEDERQNYVSVSTMQQFYRRMVTPAVREVLHNKVTFLNTFHSYVHRSWLFLPQASDQEVLDMIASSRTILKPIDGSRGTGIFFIEQGEQVPSTRIQEWRKDKLLMEECLHSEESIAAFNPESLNTIRLVMFRQGNEVIPYSAALRMGRRGHQVDNAHAGGIRALIDIPSGILQQGVDTMGQCYDIHPDSLQPITGFHIPRWQEIVALCSQATLELPDVRFVGWDIALRQDGQIEFIEGNHAPDIDGIQFSLHHGIRQELNTIFQRLYHSTI